MSDGSDTGHRDESNLTKQVRLGESPFSGDGLSLAATFGAALPPPSSPGSFGATLLPPAPPSGQLDPDFHSHFDKQQLKDFATSLVSEGLEKASKDNEAKVQRDNQVLSEAMSEKNRKETEAAITHWVGRAAL